MTVYLILATALAAAALPGILMLLMERRERDRE